MPGSVREASRRSSARARNSSGRVEPPRDGPPTRFRRPLATDPDETDRDDVHSTRDPAFCSVPLEGQELFRVLVWPGVGVARRGRHIGMPEAVADQVDRCTPVERVRRMGVPEPVR